MILLLLIPAYRGMVMWPGGRVAGTSEDRIHAAGVEVVATSISLSPVRRVAPRVFPKSVGGLGLLSFRLEEVDRGKLYRVVIRSGGNVLYEEPAFNSFDRYDKGNLILPVYAWEPGEYVLLVSLDDSTLIREIFSVSE
jgi:hypothetical protein